MSPATVSRCPSPSRGERDVARRSRRACRGSTATSTRRRSALQVSRCTIWISSPTNFFANDGMPSAGWVWSTTTSMPLPAPSTVTTSWRTRVHRVAHLLAEGRVGEHRRHGLRRGVVGHLVGELHGAIMAYGIGGRDDATRGATLAGVTADRAVWQASGAATRSQFGEQGARLTYGSYLRLRSCSTPSTSSPTRRRTTSCCSSPSTRSTSCGSSSCCTRPTAARDAMLAPAPTGDAACGGPSTCSSGCT